MSRFLNEKYRPLTAYVPGEQPQDRQYVKLNTNESPYPPAPSVVAAVTAAEVEALRLYSDPEGRRLKEKLAGLYGVRSENVFLSNGSDDILNFAFACFGQNGALFPDVTYGFYPVFAELNGVAYEEIALEDDFSIDCRAYHGAGRLVVLANPNAPTGMTVPVSAIEALLRANPDSVVLVDEAYVDFGGESCLPLIADYPNLLVVRTFSKSRSLAGGRLGYAMADAALIADLEKIKYSTNPYNVNRLTLLLGERSVDAEDYYRAMCRTIAETRDRAAERLRALGFEVLPSSANFVFARSPRLSGEALYQGLKSRGILVRHFSRPRIADFVRITVGTEEQMRLLADAIQTMLEGDLP